tara:strand:+ start:254 stop:856 length:603 start_codon:yes stop_codon:yes gene_type:complete
MFDINTFKQALPHGGARASLFRIHVPMPAMVLGAHSPFSSMKLALNAKTTTIPTGTIEPVEVPYFGRIFKMPGGRTFDEWTTTITNDEDFAVRDMIEQWMNAINDHSSNRASMQTSIMPGANYAVDAMVQQYGKDGILLRTYDMKGCWPSTVGEISLDWSEASTIEEFEVTWQFNWWESVATSPANPKVRALTSPKATWR